MNNVSYFPKNKKTSYLAKKIVAQYNLKECYNNGKNDRIFKNDNLLLSLKRKYVFMCSLSIDKNDDYLAVRKELMG